MSLIDFTLERDSLAKDAQRARLILELPPQLDDLTVNRHGQLCDLLI